MSAETLRKAAKKLREQATTQLRNVNEEPWVYDVPGWNEGYVYPVMAGEYTVAEAGMEESAEYIATMHPGVGLALAAWLESEVSAAEWREGQSEHMNADRVRPEPFPVYYDRTTERAIVVARLILGGES